MQFHETLVLLQNTHHPDVRARRTSWNAHNTVGHDPKRQSFYYTVNGGFFTTYRPSEFDVLAEDWEIVFVNPNNASDKKELAGHRD